MKKPKFFHIGVTGIAVVFFATLATVTVVAFNRTSGATHLDPAKIQEMRHQARSATPPLPA